MNMSVVLKLRAIKMNNGASGRIKTNGFSWLGFGLRTPKAHSWIATRFRDPRLGNPGLHETTEELLSDF